MNRHVFLSIVLFTLAVPTITVTCSATPAFWLANEETQSLSEEVSQNQTPWEVGEIVYISYELSHVLAGSTPFVDLPLGSQPSRVVRALPGDRAVITAIDGKLVNVDLGDGLDLNGWHSQWFTSDSRGYAKFGTENLTPYELGDMVFITTELARSLERGKAHGGRMIVVSIMGDLVSVMFVKDGLVLRGLEWDMVSKDEPFHLPRIPVPENQTNL